MMLERIDDKDNYKGGLEKIEHKPKPCLHPEHRPPSMMVYEPGTYRYTCPICGKVTVFTVNETYL